MREMKETEIGLIPKEWELKTLDDIKSPVKKAIISGPFGSNISAKYFVPTGVPVIRGNNLSLDLGKTFYDDDFVFITEEKANELNTWATKDDIIFTAVGTIGQVGILTGNEKFEKYIISNKQLRLTVDKNQVIPLFAYYWFASPAMIDSIIQRNTGSSVPLINLSVLKSLLIPVPPKDEQEFIVEMLGSFDNKIDLLKEQNKTLFELAELFFKEMFIVNLNSEWVETEINNLCLQISAGGTPSTKVKEYYNGKINWYSTKELNDNFLFDSISKITKAGLDNSSAKLFPANSILIAIYAAPTVGRLGILTNEAAFNQAACGFIVDEEKVCFEYLYLYLLYSRQKLNEMASGTAQQNLNVSTIKNLQIVLPPFEKMCQFKNIIRPMFEKIKINSIQINSLQETRDTLLPKLMLGNL